MKERGRFSVAAVPFSKTSSGKFDWKDNREKMFFMQHWKEEKNNSMCPGKKKARKKIKEAFKTWEMEKIFQIKLPLSSGTAPQFHHENFRRTWALHVSAKWRALGNYLQRESWILLTLPCSHAHPTLFSQTAFPVHCSSSCTLALFNGIVHKPPSLRFPTHYRLLFYLFSDF